MAGGGDEDDGDKSAFRCLDAARYVAAAVVIVLIAAVIVNAIRVVLRPDDITLLVRGSSVITGRALPPEQDKSLSFDFDLLADNPSGRVKLYYYSITAYVFINDTMATTPTPKDDCTMIMNPANISLPPMVVVENAFSNFYPNDSDQIDTSFFDALYKNRSVRGVTMRLDGQLVSEIRSGINTTSQNMTHYCRELVFGPEDKVPMSSQGTLCSTT